MSMNPDPYSLANVRKNPLARMLPLHRSGAQAYHMGEKNPPGLGGYSPIWEIVDLVQLGAGQTVNVRINLNRDFHLLGFGGVASSASGFRAQLFDVLKKRKFSDRPVQLPQLAGIGGKAWLLREPYEFELLDSQVWATVTNLDNGAANDIQIALFGFALRFNQPDPGTGNRGMR